MKRGGRDINIFSMSALDLFASALGAFILIAIVLFPFFPNISPDQAAARIAELNAQLQDAQAQLAECENERDQCIAEAHKKFLLIIMTWESPDDVDLYVHDPQGRVYYYKRKTHRGSDAAMEVDNIRGPGNEIWLHPFAEPGKYEVCYHYYKDRDGSDIKVRGSYITPNGRNNFEPIVLQRQGDFRQAATINIDAAGQATMQSGGTGACGTSRGG